MRRSIAPFVACFIIIALAPARADEGMWTFDAFPSERVAKAYGFAPDRAWLDHVRLSSVRLARGCSASFVSRLGLVQTNHHCAQGCIEQLSTATSDLVASGFYAKTAADERKCPNVEVNQLVAITDVTARVNAATAGLGGKALVDAKRAVEATIAKECSGGDANIRCDVVELYHGGIYDLYRYRRYQDVRLVFAPEMAIAFFGGDPDNFEFPRYDLDVAYLRVYVDDRPLDTSANFLRYAARDAQAGDLTFTSGHPGRTNRLDTVAALEFQRDVALPRGIFYNSELRGILTEFSATGAEHARIAKGMLFGVENSLKARKGQFAALVDPAIIRVRAASEAELRRKIDADPQLRAQYGAAWDNIRAALERFRGMRDRETFTEGGQGFRSRLFGFAKTLVRHAAEAKKPDEARLPEYTVENFRGQRQSLNSRAPIYPELEKLTLTFSLTKLREALGPDDPFVRKVLGSKAPAQLAAELVDGTRLADPGLRRSLIDADEATIATSEDAMIAFVRAIDPDLRAIRHTYEDQIQAELTRSSEQIAHAMFRVNGTSTYPDATFTLRLSFGAVEGYRQDGRDVAPITTIGGAFARATGADPFRLPDSWIAARGALDLDKPFNLATTNDIIGGNSGSPVINRDAEVVGLIFDGNIQSLGGDFGFDPGQNRAVAVAVGTLREALAKVYHADRIVAELAN
jgi:peptidase S46-like protein